MKNFPLAVKGFLLPFLLIFTQAKTFSQSDTITTTVLHDAESLIRNFFLDGNCIDVFNFQLRGEVGQAGFFENGMASIGLESGIVLTNGHIDSISGPNKRWNTSGGYGSNISTDPDLATLDTILTGSPQPRLFSDVLILEFDFTPTVEEATFDFVYASEEFCFYSLSNFVDIFGFFVSGPGLNGPYQNNGVNIALVPGTQTSIAANTISPWTNSEYYVSNTIPMGFDNGCEALSPATVPDLIEFDGFTVPLVARFDVIPCETYHVRLAITDIRDPDFDSAVFLKAQSFTAGRTSDISSNIMGQTAGENTPYEGCGSAEVIFSRADSLIDHDLVVHYDVLPTSTATPGIDFTPIPDSIVIPAGTMHDTIYLDFFNDNIDEGGEFFTIKLRNPCSCAESEITISIADPLPLSATVEGDQKVCNGDNLILSAIPSGGFGNISYQWPNNDPDSIYNILPIQSEVHQLIVTDDCFQSDTVDYFVDVLYPSAVIDGAGVICDGLPDFAYPIALSGADSFSFGVLESMDTTFYQDILVDTFWVPVFESGVFQLVDVVADGCEVNPQGFAQALLVDITTEVFIDSIDCFNDNDAIANVVPNNGDGVYSYQWSHDNLLTQDSAFNLGIGNYEVYIHDYQGCLDTVRFTLDQPDELLLEVDTLQLLANCSIGGGLLASGSGGSEPLAYNWSSGQTTALVENLPPAIYSISLVDAKNCTEELSIEILNDGDLPVIEVFVSDTLDCVTDSVTITTGNSSYGDDFVYNWTNASGDVLQLTDPTNWTTDIPGVYTLTIDDTTSNCSNFIDIEVLIDTIVPSTRILSDFNAISCYEPVVNLFAQDVSQDWFAEWTDIAADTLLTAGQWNVDVISGGDFEMVVTNTQNSCVNIDTFTLINQLAFPTAEIPTPDSLNCDASQVDLTVEATIGSGFYNFDWSGPTIDGPTDEIIATVTEEGLYQLIIQDEVSGCIDTLTTQVVIDTATLLLDPIPDSTLNCIVTEISLTANSPSLGNLQYTWSDEDGNELSATPQITINRTGDYAVFVIDMDNNCTQTSTITIDEDLADPVININESDTLDCVTQMIELSAIPNTEQTAAWLDEDGVILSSDSWTYQASEAGIYQLMVTNNGNGCIDTQQLELMIDTIPPLASILTPQELTCEDDHVIISLDIISGSGNYGYEWTGPVGGINGPTNEESIFVENAGAYQLTLTDNDNGCTAQLTTSVVENGDFPIIDTLVDSLINCYNPSLLLNATSPTMGDLSFQWLDEDDMILSQTSMINIESAGIYEIQLTDNSNTCVSSLSINISEDFVAPDANAGLDAQLDCINSNATLEGEIGNTNWMPSWLDADGTVLSTGEWTLNTNQTGNYQLLVLDTENGCDNNDVAVVTENQNMPIANAGDDQLIDCFTNTATLDLSGSSMGENIIYELYDGTGNLVNSNISMTIDVNQADSYLLIVSDTISHCTDQDDVLVAIEVPQITAYNSINAFCFGDEGSIAIETVEGGTPPYLYSIDAGQTYQNTPVFGGLQAGTYNITVQDINDCTGVSTAILQAPLEMSISLQDTFRLMVGDSVELKPIIVNADTSELANFYWSNGDQLSCTKCLNTTFYAGETQFLAFTIVDKNGCTASAKVLLVVDQRIPIYVPNAFSPHNEDGNNDRLVIYGDKNKIVEVINFNVYNRWGALLYSRQHFPINAPEYGWDGRFNNKPLNSNVFVYSIQVLLINGETVELAGEFVLLE